MHGTATTTHAQGVGWSALRGWIRQLACGLGAVLAVLVFCGAAQAATFTVNNPGDAADATLNGTCLTAGGVCTLRAAIQESNFSTPSADTIGFTAAAQPTINLNSALPDIVDALTISGPGAGALTVRRNAAAAYRIFTITGDVDVAISGLTIRDGLSDATTTPASSGGAIAFVGTAAATGSLSLSAVTVTANAATSATGGSSGGGVSVVLGDLTIANSTISDNTASATGTDPYAAGGGAALTSVETATLTNVSVTGNDATVSGAGGGGSAVGGGMSHTVGLNFVMSGGAISDNTASDIRTSGDAFTFGGGAAFSVVGAVTLTNVSVAGNAATASGAVGSAGGGGIDHVSGQSFVMSGGAIRDNMASATSTSSGGTQGGGGSFTVVSTVTLTNVTVAGNDALAGGAGTGTGVQGGGIGMVTGSLAISGGAVSDNTASATATSASATAAAMGGGAGLLLVNVALDDVTLDGNDATASGPGDAVTAEGGGLAGVSGSAAVAGSSISDNSAGATATSGSTAVVANGGGVSLATSPGTLTNSTVSGNDATASGGTSPVEQGGGFYGLAPITLTSATVAFNEAATGANLIAQGSSTSIGARNTIVSDPIGGANCAEVDAGDIVSDGFNLSSDASCGFGAGGDQQGVDPDLAPLANNGGPTFTHALPGTSPAVDKGSSAVSGAHPALTTDQRGKARPVDLPTPNAAGGNGADSGAFERQTPDYISTVLAGTPRGYWRFGEPSGSALLDSSPNNNHGVYLGGVVLGAAGIAGATPNTAATYDGVNDTGRVPDANSLDVGNSFTLEGWIKRSSVAKTQELFNKGGNGFQLVVMNAASQNRVWLRKANITTIAQSNGGVGGSVPADGAYHHVVATMNGPGTAKIYIDGVLSVSSLAPAQQIQDTALPLTFGIAGSTPAQYDEFALYDQVLTPAEVQAHYLAGVS